MDLSMIQTHLENFATTWENWTKVFQGFANVLKFVVEFATPGQDGFIPAETAAATTSSIFEQ